MSDTLTETKIDQSHSTFVVAQDFTKFGPYDENFALASKRAARANAALIPESKYLELIATRNELATKKFTVGLSFEEEFKLEYNGWQLDRIDDARYGDKLDQLEIEVRNYEHFAKDLETFKEQLEQYSRSRKRRKPK